MKVLKAISLVVLIIASGSIFGQIKVGDKWVDNNLTFMIIEEDIRTAGTMAVCISDTSSNCISNLQSGFEIRFYDAADQQIWAGKTAGRSELLEFPAPMESASYVVLKAFKPFVLNVATGTLIHQDKPIELKYKLE